MRIREYFDNKYETTRTQKEWDSVEQEEMEAFRLSQESLSMFREWASRNGIDLKAKSPNSEWLDVTCWGWDFDD